MEKPFRKAQFTKNLVHLRFCHILALVFYGLFGVLDAIIFPEAKGAMWILRYLIICPIFALGLAFTYHPRYARYWQALNCLYIIITGTGYTLLIFLSASQYSYLYDVGIIFCLVFGYTFIRARFLYASSGGLVVLVVYFAVSGWLIHPPIVVLYSNSWHLVGVNLLLMMICYTQELAARNEFYLTHLLERERAKVARAKEGLEEKVARRTSQLAASNRDLAREIAAHRQAEKEKSDLERKLRQAHKMEAMGTLAGGIAHDFNNILGSIIGFTELAIDDVREEGLLKSNLREVLTAGIRAKDLVKQILAFSRQADQEMKPLAVKGIILEVSNLLRASIPTSIVIRQELRSEAPVMADPIQIHQVIMNICTNAAQAMQDQGGVLTIGLEDSTSRNGKAQVRLWVEDTGAGITAEIVERIFDPFFTTKEQGEGTGMGLAVVHGIVKSHGGSIEVASTPGRGTRFDVYLPSLADGMNADATANHSLPRGTERILIVDDELALIEMAAQGLRRLGYQVESRASSVEALELYRLQADRFDLVITDLTMPQMQGDQLAREIHRINPHIPVILCTGFGAGLSRERAAAADIQAIVTKPLLKIELAKTVRKVLDEKRAPPRATMAKAQPEKTK